MVSARGWAAKDTFPCERCVVIDTHTHIHTHTHTHTYTERYIVRLAGKTRNKRGRNTEETRKKHGSECEIVRSEHMKRDPI